MVTTSLTPPTLRIQQLYTPSPVSGTRRLLPYIIGPLAHTIRYGSASERPNGFFGTYLNDVELLEGELQTAVEWPQLPAGNIVDQASAKVFIEKALLRYFLDESKTGKFLSRNTVRVPSKTFSADGNVIDAGVQVGDLIRVRGIRGSSTPFELACEVRGLRGDAVAASVVGVTDATTNRAVSTASSVVTATAGNTVGVAILGVTTTFNIQKLGRLSETYTMTVITGGGAGTARLSIRSLSGLDDVANFLVTTFDSPVAFGSHGAQLTIDTTGSGSNLLVLGDSWTVVLTGANADSTLTVGGTYTGKQNRTYIVEVVTGDRLLSSGNTRIRVTSQDGGDQALPQTVTGTTAVALGSYGLTVAFAGTNGLMKGDKWSIEVLAASEGVVHTLVLSSLLPTNVIIDSTTAEVQIELFKSVNIEIPRRSLTAGDFNYTTEATQLLLRNDIELTLPTCTLDDDLISMPIRYVAGLTGSNQIYLEYRSWYPAQSGIIEIPATSDLNTVLDGPTDKDNPLKHVVEACRITAGGQSIFAFVVGDPAVSTGWDAAAVAAQPYEAAYGYVPLTQDIALLTGVAAAVSSSREDDEIYRVGWFSAPRYTAGPLLSSVTREDHSNALAVVEDNPDATGEQFTLIRATTGNVNFVSLGIRVGDEVRYNFVTDAWGEETYSSRRVTTVQSSSLLLVSPAFAEAESIARRFEIHRTYNHTELRQRYADHCAMWGNELIRDVIAPEVLYAGQRLPGYYVAAIAAGLRASTVPQGILSTVKLPGISQVYGLESFTPEDLNYIAGHGGFICLYDFKLSAVKIRHAITTGDNEIPAKLEESMVSAIHVTLYELQKRLAPYAGQINLGDDDQFGVLAESIRAVLMAARAELIARDASVQFGGLIRDLIITDIRQSQLAKDELIIEGSLDVGNPGNRITFKLAIS